MPHAPKPLLATVFRPEPAEAWPDREWGDPDKTVVMDFARDLIASGAAEWGWLPSGDIELRLRFGPVFHLREKDVARVF